MSLHQRSPCVPTGWAEGTFIRVHNLRRCFITRRVLKEHALECLTAAVRLYWNWLGRSVGNHLGLSFCPTTVKEVASELKSPCAPIIYSLDRRQEVTWRWHRWHSRHNIWLSCHLSFCIFSMQVLLLFPVRWQVPSYWFRVSFYHSPCIRKVCNDSEPELK